MREAAQALRRATGRGARALLVLVLSFGAGCREPSPPPHVFLIVVDTLRADRVGPDAQGRVRMPFLTAFAERATNYERAYATSPWTKPSVASLLTSTLQAHHGVSWMTTPLEQNELTLAETLRDHGYVTSAVVANPLVGEKSGFSQGFDFFRKLRVEEDEDGVAHSLQARHVNLVALRRLTNLDAEQRRRPQFMYLHYMDVHSPYAPSGSDLDAVASGGPRPRLALVNEAMRSQQTSNPDPRLVREIRDAYDAAALTFDAKLEKLFAQLEQGGWLENAIVVVTSDHGEEFREHGRIGHNQALYEESLRIPLVVRAPGQKQGRVSRELASLVDVAPTILDLAGLPVPASFFGRPLDVEPGPGETIVFAELGKIPSLRGDMTHVRAVLRDDAKLIENAGRGPEFYDLESDAGESQPDALPSDVRSVLQERADWLEGVAIETYQARESAPKVEDASQAELRALGYLE